MFDLGIIGAGPAGYFAAERAGMSGLKVVIFDKRFLGGVCLNEGCIPTKTLLYSAKLYQNALKGKTYGVEAENVKVNFSTLMQRKNKVVKKLVSGVAAKMKHAGAEVIFSEAFVKGKGNNGFVIEAGGKEYTCRNILVATGSEAAVPPIPGAKEFGLTNREILSIDYLPSSVNIIGAGVIGIEFGSFFASIGTKVRIFEMLDGILPGMDRDLSLQLQKNLTAKGIEIYTGVKVSEVKEKAVVVNTSNENKTFEGDVTLVAAGRKLNVDNLGLENINLDFSSKGIKIDEKCRTNVPGVYAAGDITGVSLLAHTAYREAEVAVNTIIGKRDRIRYHAIPSVVYTNPEFSSVGYTEEQLKKKGEKFVVQTLPMAYAGRFIAENEGENGIVKVIIDEKYRRILGVHMLGNPSSEIIYGAAMAIEMEMTVDDFKEIVFPHPTVSEILKEIAYTF